MADSSSTTSPSSSTSQSHQQYLPLSEGDIDPNASKGLGSEYGSASSSSLSATPMLQSLASSPAAERVLLFSLGMPLRSCDQPRLAWYGTVFLSGAGLVVASAPFCQSQERII